METQKNGINEKIGAKELESEITPILKDMFVADVKQNENGIMMRFMNGQTFFLNVREN